MIELRRNADGSLDEVVCDAVTGMHLEQMDDDVWILLATLPDGRELRLTITADTRVSVEAEIEA